MERFPLIVRIAKKELKAMLLGGTYQGLRVSAVLEEVHCLAINFVGEAGYLIWCWLACERVLL